MSTVIFLSGETMGDSLGAIGRGYASAFAPLGLELVEIKLSDPKGLSRLDELARTSKVEFALTFANMGGTLGARTSDGKDVNYWDGMGIPLISIFGDTPAYFFDRHVMPSDRGACLYAYPEHLEFRQTLPDVRGLLGTLPPGPMEVTPKASIDFRRKERGRLLFLKNGNDPDALLTEWRECLHPRVFLMLADIGAALVERMGTDPVNRVDHMVDRYFVDRGLDIAHAYRLRLFAVAQLDDYLRRVKSTLMAKVLMDFPVDMFGYNWDHLDFSGKRISFNPGGNYASSSPMIRDSLGIIDMSPNTGRVPHERPLRAFGMHTLCLTNEQSFFRQHIRHCDAFSFTFSEESFRSKIADVIAKPKTYVEVGIEAAESFCTQFSGEQFADLLVDVAATLNLACGPRPGRLQDFFGWPPSSKA